MAQPNNVTYHVIDSRPRVQVQIFGDTSTIIQGHIWGYDRYFNLILDEAVEYNVETEVTIHLGRILLNTMYISSIQSVTQQQDG